MKNDERFLVAQYDRLRSVPAKDDSQAEASFVGFDTEATQIAQQSEPQARGYLSKEQAFKFKVLPLRIEYRGTERVLVAAAAVNNTFDSKTRLHFASGLPVEIVTLSEESLALAIEQSYYGDKDILYNSINDLRGYAEHQGGRKSAHIEINSEGNEVTRFLARLLEYASAHKATDIHLTPRREGAFVKLRINGELLDHTEALVSLEIYRQIVSRIKILAGLDTTSRMHPQDGRFAHQLGNRSIEIRVSTLPTIYGENVVLRVFAGGKVLAIDSLGYDERIVRSIGAFIKGPFGLLLVSGPTGSGKTSALYSIVAQMLQRNFAIATIEDPVEISLNGVVQSSLSEVLGYSYEVALRAVLRQDPDAILIGELRDAAAVKSALDASMSGHHVLSTIHGARVIDVLRRLESLGGERLAVFQALSLVVTQRLVNRLCQNCKVFDLRSANSIGCDVYQPVGCEQCSYSGFLGKRVIAEALFFDEEIRERLSFSMQITSRVLKEIAGAHYLMFQDQCLNALERGDISYEQYLELS
jgi:type II secretory ATPase GspE/PulE/Tfp pilus assembly ATPase PilB-like protein